VTLGMALSGHRRPPVLAWRGWEQVAA
jgi:hypothetical protein